MGKDKALIPVYGVPLIRRVYDAAAPNCDSVYVISAWGDRYQSVLPKECQFINEQMPVKQPIQEDVIKKQDSPLGGSSSPNQEAQPIHSHGPLVGFYQGLTYLQQQATWYGADYWVLLLACDLPHLNAAVIQDWRDCLRQCSTSTIALLPPHETKGWHPLCGFYHHRCLPSLKTFIAEGGRSFQKWLAQEEVQSLPVNDSKLLFNCNTPNELRQLFRAT